MSSHYDIGIFGGDLRQVYMAAALLDKGYTVATCGIDQEVASYIQKKRLFEPPVINAKDSFDLEMKLSQLPYGQLTNLSAICEQCTLLIGPIPMSRDQLTLNAKHRPDDFTISQLGSYLNSSHILIGGNIPATLIELCQSRSIPYYDLMKDEEITILNAIATAEGTIMEAIKGSSCNLHGSTCLVLGYGRCARVLAQKLKALDASVVVAARSKEALANAQASGCKTIFLNEMSGILSQSPFIFNTIPALVLGKEQLDLVDPKAIIIDIASAPGGVDFKYAETLQLNAKLCLGLPGKYSPETSSDILVNAVLTFIKERCD